ncbi:MAG: hypothetical protein GY926_19470 [bacterium]|nr:hypothetical protein [bacterium]
MTIRFLPLTLLVACGSPGADALPEEAAAPLAVVVDADGWEGVPPPPDPLPKAFPPEPPGFGKVDRFVSHDEACFTVTHELVPYKWRGPVRMWCLHRSHSSSRNGTVTSRVDGSEIHDRDRPTAWRFWNRLVSRGVLDPYKCPYHAINRNLKHTANCVKLRRNWPFKDVELPEATKRQWALHPHDMERFGARGPHDNNGNAFNHIPGCWDPKQLERFDVGITVTVLASLKICERFGCKTKWDIKRCWGGKCGPV